MGQWSDQRVLASSGSCRRVGIGIQLVCNEDATFTSFFERFFSEYCRIQVLADTEIALGLREFKNIKNEHLGHNDEVEWALT